MESSLTALIRKRVTEQVWQKLMPHQREALVSTVERNGRNLLSHEQGLGKTCTSQSIILYYRDATPALFVTTTSNTHNTVAEARMWIGLPLAMIQRIDNAKTKINPKARLVVISHNLAVRKADELLAHKFRIVVIDEAHCMKNYETQTTIVLTKLMHQADTCRVLMTGTPMDRPRDLYPLIHALRPELFSGFQEYAKRYCAPRQCFNAKEQRFYWVYTGKAHLPELAELLRTKIMHRCLKTDVLHDLPPKERLRVDLVVKDPESVAAMRAELAELDKLVGDYRKQQQDAPRSHKRKRDEEEDDDSVNNKKRRRPDADDEGNAFAKLFFSPSSPAAAAGDGLAVGPDFEKLACDKELGNLIRRSMHKFKIPSVVSYVKKLLKSMREEEGNTDKVLLFGHHKAMCRAIARRVVKSGFKFIMIDGTVKPRDRAERVQQFQTDPDMRVAVLSLDACGAAINLFAANVVVKTEIRFSGQKHGQAEDRAHRIGQKRPVKVLYLVLKDSIDERIYSMLQSKMQTATQTLDQH